MREFQLDKVMLNPDAPIPENMRLIRDEDIERYQLLIPPICDNLLHVLKPVVGVMFVKNVLINVGGHL